MSSIRISRIRFITAAATVALAAFSLTACDDASGVRNEGASPVASSTVSTSVTPAASPGQSNAGSNGSDAESTPVGSKPAANNSAGKGADTKGADSKGSDSKGAVSKGSDSSGKAVTCEGSNTKTVAAPLNRPVNHMLLTVTNTGSKTCFLYGYPAVRFGDAQSVPPVIEESHPQAVVTLNPGESGYASVSLSASDGSSAHGHTVKSLAVYFHGRSGNESVGAGANPSLPAGGTYVDDSLQVSYWQQSMDDALGW